MTNNISFFIKDFKCDTGVFVAVTHLSRLLLSHNITNSIYLYQDDNDLLQKVSEIAKNSKCLNFHIPSFQDETFYSILKMHNNIVLSIHSTICNLQTEDDVLSRLIDYTGRLYNNLHFTCPSYTETKGFNAIFSNQFTYLPNSFWINDNLHLFKPKQQSLNTNRKIKISLICAYRPLKNITIQIVAIVMLSHKYNLELHLITPNKSVQIYEDILKILKFNHIPYVLHNEMNNRDCYKLIGSMDIGLQVSLTETFSYVAFEHMIQGVPVVASESVDFASEIVSYSDVNSIVHGIERIINSPENYLQYQIIAYEKARSVQSKNNSDALNAIKKLISHD